MITKETRLEAYVTRPVTRGTEILAFLSGKELTAREIAYGMGYSDLNAVRPRLTELREIGLIEVAGKRKCTVTNKNVAVWKVV